MQVEAPTYPLLPSQYDVKKIEEVVYDITLRGLLKAATEKKGMPSSRPQEEVESILTLLKTDTSS